MKKISKFYETPYKLFKMLPKVRLILFAIIFLVLGVMDSSRERYGEFGIFKSDSSSEEFMIWLVVGALVCGYIYIMTTIEIAPVIIQTDALMEIQTHTADGKNIEAPLAPPTPQPISENEYFCEKMEEIGMFRSGKCSSCLKEYAKLELCKIKYSDNLTQKYLCPSCKDKFRKNSK